jgi:DNA-binding XRE family transcriptional regulator
MNTKWDRMAYFDRGGDGGGRGGAGGARGRPALMPRQSGDRLAEERKRSGLSQVQVAEAMGVTPTRVSQIENGELCTIEAVARYVQALGGRLDLVASFGDHTLTVATVEGS